MLLGQQNQWRVDNIIDGLGIDAHEVLKHSHKFKPESEAETEQALRACFKQLAQLLISGTFVRDPEGRKNSEIKGEDKLPVQCLVTRKNELLMKARLVALGNREVEGVDYDKDALSMSHPSKAATAIFYQKCTALKIIPRSDDFVCAYIQVKWDPKRPKKVLSNLHGLTGRNDIAIVLGTELYGTHTSGPNFDAAKRKAQADCGWVPLHPTESDWVVKESDGKHLDLMVYTDDALSISHKTNQRSSQPTNAKDCPVLAKALQEIAQTFPMKEADPSKYLGTQLQFETSHATILVSVQSFIHDMAVALDLLSLPKTRFPFSNDADHSYGEKDGYCSNDQKAYYLKAIGCLAWTVREQVISFKGFHARLAQYQAKPTLKWYRELRRTLKFIHDHVDSLHWVHSCDSLKSVYNVYVDASHHDDLDTCGTTIGYVSFNSKSCLNARSKKKRQILSVGTAGNEARALHDPLNESIREFDLLRAAEFSVQLPPGLISDNIAALIMMTGANLTPCARYLKPKLLRVRQLYAQGKLRLGYVASEYNHADLLTKTTFTEERFWFHVRAIQDGQPALDKVKWIVTEEDIKWLRDPSIRKREEVNQFSLFANPISPMPKTT